MLKLVWDALPAAYLAPDRAILFAIVLYLVAVQYRRIAAEELELWGLVKNQALAQTVLALMHGFAGGILASFLLVYTGVTIEASGLLYLWPLALLLGLATPRMMCFAYAGGVLSLIWLATGWPAGFSVGAMAALVAILHLTEAVLMWLSAPSSATPLYVDHGGRKMGGYFVRRFWPVPIVLASYLAQAPPGVEHAGGLVTPDWWPLFPDPRAAADGVYVALPVVAGIGYSDIALNAEPGRRVTRTALHLIAYSGVLFGLGWLAVRTGAEGWAWAAALFAPFGHEWLAAIGARLEMTGRPRWPAAERAPRAEATESSPRAEAADALLADQLAAAGEIDLGAWAPQGVELLDVVPDGPAWRAGLRPGDRIMWVDGRPVDSTEALRTLAGQGAASVLIEYRPAPRSGLLARLVARRAADASRPRSVRLPRPDPFSAWGMIPVPGADDAAVELIDPWSEWSGRLARLRARFGARGRSAEPEEHEGSARGEGPSG